MSVILGFDTATEDTAVALSGAGVSEEALLGPKGGRPVHGSALLGAIEAAVDGAGGWGAIDLIAVGIGPGSFTGLRIGISTARALAQSRGLQIAGVPSSSALLAGIAARPAADGRRAIAVLDARRGEVFVAASGPGAPVEPAVCPPDEIGAVLGAELVAGAVAGGEGAVRFRAQIEASGLVVLPDGDAAHRLSAVRICELGASIDPVGREAIRPIYLRRPDAELWRERDGRN